MLILLLRANSFDNALVYVQSMFGAFDGSIQMNKLWLVWYGHDVSIALIVAAIFSFPVIPQIKQYLVKKEDSFPKFILFAIELFKYIGLTALFITCLIPLFGATYNAFIYFRF